MREAWLVCGRTLARGARSIRRFSAICSRVTAGSATKIAIGTLLGVWPPIHRLRTIRHDLVQTVRRPIFRAWIAGSQYRLFRIGFSSPDALCHAVAGIHGQDQVLVGIERATLRKMKAAVDRDVVRHRSPRSCLAERADGLARRKLLGSSWGHQEAQNFRPLMKDLEGNFQHLGVTGSTRIAWQSQDLNPAGVVGNALDADAERGAQLINQATAQFVSILKEVDRYPLGNLNAGPLNKVGNEIRKD